MCQSMSQIREVNDYKDESEGFLEPFGLLGQESTLRAFCTMMTEGFRLSRHFCHVSKSEGVCLLLNVCTVCLLKQAYAVSACVRARACPALRFIITGYHILAIY